MISFTETLNLKIFYCIKIQLKFVTLDGQFTPHCSEILNVELHFILLLKWSKMNIMTVK